MELLEESGGGLFYIRLAEGVQSFLRFKVEGMTMVIEAVFTPEEFRGGGLAAKLMDEAVKHAEKHGYRVLPKCSYTEYYFKKHPEKRRVCLGALGRSCRSSSLNSMTSSFSSPRCFLTFSKASSRLSTVAPEA